MTEETIDKIERYLNGELSVDELSEFEAELKKSPELQQQVDFMRLLPGAIEAHSDEQLSKQLKEIESTLPKVEINVDETAAAQTTEPKSISYPYWAKLAMAASVLLLVGLFIFNDSLFKSGIEDKQLAESDKIDKKVHIESVSVKSIGDSGFGFAADSRTMNILVVQRVDTSYLNNFITEFSDRLQGRTGAPAGDGNGPQSKIIESISGIYHFKDDTLFIVSSEVDSAIELYDINLAAQKVNNDEIPEIRSMYLHFRGSYYKLDLVSMESPLIKEKNEVVLKKLKELIF